MFHGTIDELAEARPGEEFDTFVMLGNNLGLLGGPVRAREVLATIGQLAVDGARIVGTAGHIYKTDNPDHLGYHELNRSLGRMPGELRLRVRYRLLASEWFDYLFASPSELANVVGPSGWPNSAGGECAPSSGVTSRLGEDPRPRLSAARTRSSTVGLRTRRRSR